MLLGVGWVMIESMGEKDEEFAYQYCMIDLVREGCWIAEVIVLTLDSHHVAVLSFCPAFSTNRREEDYVECG